MLDLHNPDATNLVASFLVPGGIGCVTVAVLQLRPGSDMTVCRINDDIDEYSRVKFARFLETMARSLRHYKPGEMSYEDIPTEADHE